MAHFSVVTPCFNEEANILELHSQIHQEFSKIENHSYEHIFIDNASSDNSVLIIKELIRNHSNVRLIVNTRNFGHIRSPFYAILQTDSDGVILLAADLQDPPQLIPKLIAEWENGFKIVKAVKSESEESPLMFALRKAFYSLISRISDIELTKNHTGSGLYDRMVINVLRELDSPYPYFRGLLSELGFASAEVKFFQPTRKRGVTKNNFYTLYDIAMLGITSHSKVPLRIATFSGFILGIMSLAFAFIFLTLKLIYWERFQAGMTPVLIGMFFLGSIQLFFLGIIGEYVGNIFTQVQKRPLVIEKERINFPKGPRSDNFSYESQ